MLGILRDDVRYAVRSLCRQPGYAAVAALTLAVGVGANTAIFSVLHAVVLRDLPYRDADRLAILRALNLHQQIPDGTSYLNVRDWKAQSRAFEDMAVYRRPESAPALITGSHSGGSEPERVPRILVGPGFFQVLGAPALLGRTFDPADFDAGQQTVVLSHRLWRQRFGGDRGAIGRSIHVNGAPATIVGVMPPDFAFPAPDTQLWQPLFVERSWEARLDPRSRGGDGFVAIGRLSATATLDTARADLHTIAARLRQAYPVDNAGNGVLIDPLTEHVLGPRTARALWLLLGAVGFVLLIACANVANLGLARGAARRHELAVRTALGASRPRLVRLALAESLVLAGLAATVGLLFAWLGTTALRTWAAGSLPRLDTVQVDRPVFLFALIVALACGLAAGLFPALQSSGVNPLESLRDSGARALAVRGGRRLRHGLVIAEIALAVVLLSGAGLLIRSFVRLQSADRGFDSQHVLLLQIQLTQAYDGQARKAEYFRDAFARLRSLPGVIAAGAISDLFIERNPDLRVTIEGRPRPRPDDPAPPLIRDRVVPGYFEALRLPLLQGRLLRDSDLVADLDVDQPTAVVISEAMARQFWPGENAVGRRFKIGLSPGPREQWTTVVGVVADMKRQRLDDAAVPCIYWPGYGPLMDVVVRTAGDPAALRDAIRATLHALDPAVPPYGILSVEQRLAETVAIRTLQTLLLAVLAAAALVLATVGVYAIIHDSVVARTQEIGLRMALGASQPLVLRMVLSSALGLAAGGLTLGLLAAIILARAFASFLYETSPLDPLIHLGVGALLIAVTTVACLLPARRAARIDPMAALRAD